MLKQKLKRHTIISLKKLTKVIEGAEQKCGSVNRLSAIVGSRIDIEKSQIFCGEN